jgi:exopolysaccharide biosynthesis polyprenyl glycosylphosphotransferase
VPLNTSKRWEIAYARRLFITDFIIICGAVFLSQLRYIPSGTNLELKSFSPWVVISYDWISIVIICIWLLSLQLFGTRERRTAGAGNKEYRRVFQGTLASFAIVAISGYLFQAELSRIYTVVLFVSGLITLTISRWLWRKWLTSQRKQKKYIESAMLVGSGQSVQEIEQELLNHPEAGLQVVGKIVLDNDSMGKTTSTKKARALASEILNKLQASSASHLVICSSDVLSPAVVKELSWELDPLNHELIVAPSIIGVGGPRIHSRPLAGLPLLYIETPDFEGNGPISKRALDVVLSGLLIILLSPIFLVVAIAIKATSPGPIFYRQERVGLDGRLFGMIKFRSMKVNADDQLAALLEAEGKGDTPFFKVDNDPRVTSIGKFLRKYSIDELPQLFNVFVGDMSLVGPRPQRPAEVELYDHVAARRLLVKPGMTGLWQVSGRSMLSWEESIRLDLYYVENWSLSADFLILARTAKAVLKPGETAK